MFIFCRIVDVFMKVKSLWNAWKARSEKTRKLIRYIKKNAIVRKGREGPTNKQILASFDAARRRIALEVAKGVSEDVERHSAAGSSPLDFLKGIGRAIEESQSRGLKTQQDKRIEFYALFAAKFAFRSIGEFDRKKRGEINQRLKEVISQVAYHRDREASENIYSSFQRQAIRILGEEKGRRFIMNQSLFMERVRDGVDKEMKRIYGPEWEKIVDLSPSHFEKLPRLPE
jgi:hypothetical protein